MSPSRRRRNLVKGVSGWLFGLGSTVLLLGLWGRAVVVDTDQLAESLTPLATSDLVAQRIAGWMEDELVESGVDPVTASDTAGQVLTHSEVQPLIEDVVAEGVAAAASADPSGSSVDVAAILLPSSARIAAGLSDAGVPVSAADVEAALDDLDPLVIRGPSERPLLGKSSPLASTLGIGALLGILLMTVAGSAYVLSTPDRMRALRSLLTRFALGSLSFAVLLKIGSWIVDPDGGRAPLGESLALLANSKWLLPMTIGLCSLGAAFTAWVFRTRVRPVEVSRSPSEQPIRQEA